MQIMFEQECTTRLSGRVEIDDAYLGGEHPEVAGVRETA
jgi:hypothetical protein